MIISYYYLTQDGLILFIQFLNFEKHIKLFYGEGGLQKIIL